MGDKRYKKWTAQMAAVFTVIGLSLSLTACQKSDVVTSVDGYPISQQEFELFLDQTKTDVIRYFKTEHNVSLSNGDWKTVFGGETPEHVWMERAMEEAVFSKTEQVLAMEKGIVQDISYESCLKKMREENTYRETTVKNGGIIYGLPTYTEKTYYDYVQSNLRIQLKEKLAAEELKVEEAVLKQQYEALKDMLFHQGYEMDVMVVSEDKSENMELFPFDRGSEDYLRREIYLCGQRRQSGDRVELMDGEGSQVTVVYESIVNLGYRSFEEVKDYLLNMSVEERYEDFIRQNFGIALVSSP